MSDMGNMEGFFTRHSKKPNKEDAESINYKGLSESGVELAGNRAEQEIMEMIEKSPPGSVIFISGASDAIRTKSTGEVYGDKLKDILKDKPDQFLFISKNEIINMGQTDKGARYKVVIEKIQQTINSNPDKKIIVNYPLFIKQFAMGRDRWTDNKGNLTEYASALLKKHSNNEFECMKDWIKNEGKMDELQGPDPTQVANEHLAGLRRLGEFVKKHIPNRPVVIGATGHSWNVDALAIYLANEGKVDLEGLKKVGDAMIKETELMKLKIDNGKTILNYREKEFKF